jgi:putative ABC transport system substrate-binding protein
MLKEIIPSLARVGALASTQDLFTKPFVGYLQEGASAAGIALKTVAIDGPQGFDGAFAEFARDGTQALVVQGIFNPHRAPLLSLAARHAIPLATWDHDVTRGGGLFSLVASATDRAQRTASFVDRIIKGANPGDLPVEQPTKFELVVNEKTARGMGLTIPRWILAAADEIVE